MVMEEIRREFAVMRALLQSKIQDKEDVALEKAKVQDKEDSAIEKAKIQDKEDFEKAKVQDKDFEKAKAQDKDNFEKAKAQDKEDYIGLTKYRMQFCRNFVDLRADADLLPRPVGNEGVRMLEDWPLPPPPPPLPAKDKYEMEINEFWDSIPQKKYEALTEQDAVDFAMVHTGLYDEIQTEEELVHWAEWVRYLWHQSDRGKMKKRKGRKR